MMASYMLSNGAIENVGGVFEMSGYTGLTLFVAVQDHRAIFPTDRRDGDDALGIGGLAIGEGIAVGVARAD